jgi:hypothetical protein
MPKKVDLLALKKKSVQELRWAMGRYDNSENMHYLWRRWIARMTAVEIHAIWERYVEARLVAALNHSPKHFLEQQNIAGVTRISKSFARYIIRGGGRFFDFRSMSDLKGKANRWLGLANPFNSLTAKDRAFIDCLAAVRNCVVHGSEASVTAYKQSLKVSLRNQSSPRTR